MTTNRSSATDLADLADSRDIRDLLIGRISPSGIPIRRDRTELAAVLDRSMRQESAETTHRDTERNSK